MVVLLAFVWLPIVVIFGVILCVRAQSLDRLTEQRKLDRCLYQVINQRCATLASLSESNLTLKRIAKVLAAMKVAEGIVSIALPGFGKIAGSAVMTVGSSGARGLARALETKQNAELATLKLQTLSLWRCGPVLKGNSWLQIKRGQSVVATIAGVPSPLEWQGSAEETQLEVMGWRLGARSFAHCAPREQREGLKIESLDGESYQVRFDRPTRDRPLSRSLSSWR